MSDALDRLRRESGLQVQQVDASRQLAREALGILAGAVDEAFFGLPEVVARLVAGDESIDKWIRENESGYRKGELVGTVAGLFLPTGSLVGRGLSNVGGRVGGTVGRALSGAGRFLSGASSAGRSIGHQLLSAAGRGAIEGGLESGIRAATNRRDVLSEGLAGAAFGAAGGALGEGLRQARRIIPEIRKGTQGAVLSGAGLDMKNLRSAMMKSTGAGSMGQKIKNAQGTINDITDFVKRNPDLQHAWGRDDLLGKLKDQTSRMYKQIDEMMSPDRINLDEAVKKALNSADGELADLIHATPEIGKAAEDIIERVNQARTFGAKRQVLQDIIDSTDPAKVVPTDMNLARFRAAKIVRDSLDELANAAARESGIPDLVRAGKDWKSVQALSSAELRNMARLPPGSPGSTTFEKSMIGGLLGGAAGYGGSADDPDRLRNTILTAIAGGVGGNMLGKAGGKIIQSLGSKADDILETLTKNKGAMDAVSSAARNIGRPIAQVVGRGGASTLATLNKAQQAEYLPGSTVSDENLSNNASSSETLATNSINQAEQIGEATAEISTNPERYESLVTQKIYEKFAMSFPEYADDMNAFQEFLGYAREASNGFDPIRTAELLFPHPEERKAYLEALTNQKMIRQGIRDIKDGAFFGLGEGIESQGARSTVKGAFVDAAKSANIPSREAEALFHRIMNMFPNNPRAREAALYEQMERWNARGFRNLRQVGLI